MGTDTVKQTKLWDKLNDLLTSKGDHKAIADIEKACNDAEDILTKIPDTFPTYTLHDATHSLNVCKLMAELLGEDGISKLVALEAALLILSAYYHDIGMVYTQEEKEALLHSQEFKDFQKEQPYAYIKIKENNEEIPDDIADLYFRSIHHQRMERIPDLIIEGIPIRQYLISLCKSHGETVDSGTLKEINKDIVDLVFCAILLRLADIMDFDQSRAPDVLYDFLKLKDSDNTHFETSKIEFLKHKAALGFNFSVKRENGWKLPFFAKCEDIEIEHDIRSFLDIIDKELVNCKRLLSDHSGRWEKFSLPLSIGKKGIYGSNYQYGQYLFTLEQDQVIDLFTGENLYSDKTVFVRELLQNAIDAVLYREARAQYYRENYQPRIDFTTWKDNESYQWIRIDDNGMGMDEQKIRDYFLRVGKSFYTSDEFIADSLKFNDQGGHFKPISRFGIGVLSCFLAGDIVEVSTLASKGSAVRLSMNKSAKYFMLQLKDKQHKAKEMPSAPGEKCTGFLNIQGTSIAVRINPKQHVYELNFMEIIKKIILCPPVPIFLNGEKVSLTEKEYLASIDKTEIVKFPIPENIIKDVYNKRRVIIEPESFIAVGLLNLEKFTTKANKKSLKGALFLAEANLIYTDEFYNRYKECFEEENHGAVCSINIEDKRLMLYIKRSKHNVILKRIPSKQRKWFSEDTKVNESDFWTRSKHLRDVFNLEIDFNKIEWYSEYISYFKPSYDASYMKENYLRCLAHNGISFFSNKTVDILINEDFSYRNLTGYMYMILCHDKFRPNMSIAREKIKSLPLEMVAETNLTIRKAIAYFEIMNNVNKDQKNNITTINRDFLLNINGIDAPISTQNIYNLSNIKDWDKYYCQQGWMNQYCLQSNYTKNIIYRYHKNNISLPLMIYRALFQKKYLLKYIYNKHNINGHIIIINKNPEQNDIIDRYYPPLFFLLFDDKETFLFTSYNDRFLNREHPDSDWLIEHTKSLHDNYPALFNALVNAVYFEEEDKFNALWKKIKTLPLKSN